MKRYFVLLFFVSLSMVCVMAQKASDVFVSMPQSILPTLSQVNKADMVDFLANNMKAVVKNSFDQNVEMIQMTDSYVSVNTSSVGNMQMKLLPLNDTTKVVCVVKTVCPQACASNIRFYTTDWKQLPVDNFFTMPEIADFVIRDDSVFVADSLAHSSLQDIDLYKFELSPDKDELAIRSTIKDYATREENERLQRWLKPDGVVLKWRNGKFELQK